MTLDHFIALSRREVHDKGGGSWVPRPTNAQGVLLRNSPPPTTSIAVIFAPCATLMMPTGASGPYYGQVSLGDLMESLRLPTLCSIRGGIQL